MQRHLEREFQISIKNLKDKGIPGSMSFSGATRLAFFAGAQAFYKCVMSLFDEDHEVTEHDMRIMQDLDSELAEHARKFNVKKSNQG